MICCYRKTTRLLVKFPLSDSHVGQFNFVNVMRMSPITYIQTVVMWTSDKTARILHTIDSHVTCLSKVRCIIEIFTLNQQWPSVLERIVWINWQCTAHSAMTVLFVHTVIIYPSPEGVSCVITLASLRPSLEGVDMQMDCEEQFCNSIIYYHPCFSTYIVSL